MGDTPNGLDFSRSGIQGHYYNATGCFITLDFQYPMRATPSFTISNVSAGTVYSNGVGRAVTNVTINTLSPTNWNPACDTSSATAGHGGHFDFGSGVFATLSAEL